MKLDANVWETIEQMMKPENIERIEKEEKARARFIVRLFKSFRESDRSLAKHYAESTWEIPVFFLGAAVIALERTRVFPTLPTLGELWQTARMCAGMHRQQYRAGHYLPPPKQWPAPGTRHAINTGEVESLPRDPMRLLSGDDVAHLAAGRDAQTEIFD